MKKFKNFLFLFGIILPLSSCDFSQQNSNISYLNYYYELVRVGDLHGINPTENEVLDRNKGFTSYKDLFDCKNCFINYQCKGTNFSDFICETTFQVKTKKGETIFSIVDQPFLTSYSGGQSGNIIFQDPADKEKLGPIYVYTPYWCRWQHECVVDEVGTKKMLTFEFWKMNFNPLPEIEVLYE